MTLGCSKQHIVKMKRQVCRKDGNTNKSGKEHTYVHTTKLLTNIVEQLSNTQRPELLYAAGQEDLISAMTEAAKQQQRT